MRVLIVLVQVCIVLSCYGVEGRGRPCLFSEENEDLELERELKILTKPAIKTIQTEFGQIFDCVDIYKQPAFDHPLLKDHKIQMKPSLHSEGVINDVTSPLDESLDILKDGGCPTGTVPIRRVSKKNLASDKFARPTRLTQFSEFVNHSEVINPTYRLAGQDLPLDKYTGIRARINRWQIPCRDDQFIAYHITASDDDPRSLSAIHVGYKIQPAMYDDDFPHLHGYWTKDNGQHTGCSDTLCPGFVQISTTIPLGSAIIPPSEYMGTQYDTQFTLFSDLAKSWWLIYRGENIGYWPRELFSSQFPKYATSIMCTGAVAYTGTRGWPQMGSGHFAEEGYGRASYIGDIQVLRLNAKDFVPLDPKGVRPYVESPRCYTSIGNQKLPFGGYSIFYGGPGGPFC